MANSMTPDIAAQPVSAEILNRVVLQQSVEQFLYHEAQLLDHWKWPEWLELFADDILYWMPVRKNRLRRQRDRSEVPDGIEMAHFYDDHASLRIRVDQMSSGVHWAEDPPSRCRHLITNVMIQSTDEDRSELAVHSNFIVYRNRLESETDIWAGERQDVLRHTGSAFKIARRTILLDQNVVQSKNLSVFF